MRDFVDQVYVPDTLAIAGFYKDWFAQGEGLGNFMTYGDFPAKGMDDPASFLIPPGVILEPRSVHDPPGRPQRRRRDPGIRRHSWYDYSVGKERACIPTRARPSSTTPARSRPTSNWMSSKAIPG